MPISIQCPNCATPINARDEYAGRRVKCPKCATPITLPGDPPAATPAAPAVPVAARPATPVAAPPVAGTPVAARPRTEDDEDDRPARNGRGNEDHDADDDGPRKRRAAADADDDSPRRSGTRRSRRGDDNEDAPKKKSKLPLILGIVGGVLLVCGGGCAGVVIWAQNQAKTFASNLTANSGNDPFNIKPKIETAQRPPEPSIVDDTLTVAEYVDRIKAKQTAGIDGKWVLLTGKVTVVNVITQPGKEERGDLHLASGREYVICSLAANEWKQKPDFNDAKSYQIIGKLNANPLSSSMDWCRVVKEVDDPVKPPVGGEDRTPVGQSMADNLVNAAKGRVGQWMQVNGKVAMAIEPTRGGSNPNQGQLVLETGGKGQVTCHFDRRAWQARAWHEGDEVQLKGKVTQAEEKVVVLGECEMLKATPGGAGGGTTPPPATEDKPVVVAAADLLAEVMKDAKAADKKYKDKTLTITAEAAAPPTAAGLALASKTDGGTTYVVTAIFPPNQRQGLADVKAGDAVTVTGKYGPLINGTKKLNLQISSAKLVPSK